MSEDWMPSETCHVYIIAHMKGRSPCAPVKIGISQTPEKRLAALQTANPKRLVLLATFATPNRDFAKVLEGAFHEVMVEHRLAGEWFDIAPMRSIDLMCNNFRGALSHFLAEDPEGRDFALQFSGTLENERLVEKWRAHAAAKINNDNAPGDKCR